VRRHAAIAWTLAGAALAGDLGAAVLGLVEGGRSNAWWLILFAEVAVLTPLAVGTLLALRRPRNPIGWLLLADALLLVFLFFVSVYAEHAAGDGTVGLAGRWAVLLDDSLWPLFFAGPVAIALVFPDGRLPSPRWRGIAVAMAAVFALFILGGLFDPEPFADPYAKIASPLPSAPEALMWPVYLLGLPGLGASLFAAFYAVRSRYRRGSGLERLQILWLAYAGGLIPLTFVVCIAMSFLGVESDNALTLALACMHAGVSLAVGVAVMRYRLYEIDRIVNRTVVYVVLTTLLAAAWAGTVLLLGVGVGQGSPWATAGATLVAAIAFRPLRARVQDAVDRRFDRRRYDAVRQVEIFQRELREDRAAPEGVGEMLARALGDPELEVAFWLPESGVHADAAGRTVDPHAGPGQAITPLTRGGVPLGVVVHDQSLAERRVLLEPVLVAAGLPIEIARLRVELRRQLAEVQASRSRIVAAGYEERRRIERDLHDGAQQRLVSVGLSLRHIQHELGPSANGAATALDDAVGEVGRAIGDLRELARGVRPARLDDGLAPALRELADRTPMRVEVEATGERFPAEIEATAYFVASEAMANAVKHARASAITIRAGRDGTGLAVTIADDGCGGALAGPGSGLSGLADRAAAHGGRLRVTSAPGAGTTVVAELPCE
jgi:signal transduction histidine kinase